MQNMDLQMMMLRLKLMTVPILVSLMLKALAMRNTCCYLT